MRFRIRLVRTQSADKHVTAANETAAISKVREELAQPYGLLGQWDNGTVEIAEVEVVGGVDTDAAPIGEGPLLLSVKDAATHLGISRSLMYELIHRAEIKSITLGRRRLVSRVALNEFISSQEA